MKLLLVSWAVAPMSGGSAVIVENLAKNFTRDEMIVLGSARMIRRKPIRRSSQDPKFFYFRSELDFFGRGYRFFIWFRRLRFQPLIERIKNLIVEEDVTHVMGVYPNPFYCLAASRAARQLNVPFYSYFHNTYSDNAAITDAHASGVQQEIFENSRIIFVMSAGMQQFYEQKYAGHTFSPLVHTFNQWPNKSADDGRPNTDVCRLVAIGNFNESNLDATRRFIRAIENHPEYELHIYTHVPKWLLKRRGIHLDRVRYHHAVSPDQVHTELQKYDICILTHGFAGGYGEIEYQTIFPTRSIPFLLSGKPILVHAPKDSFLSTFVRDHGCGILVDQKDETAILRGLESLRNDELIRDQVVLAARKTASQFYGPEVADGLRQKMLITNDIM